MTKTIVNETIFTGMSDHCLICSTINMKCHTSENTLQKRITDHSRLNQLFTQSIANLPQNVSANERLNYVISTYNEILNDCTRTVTQRVKLKGSCPWMTLDLWKLIRIKDKILKKKRNNPNDNHTAALLAHVSKKLQEKKAKAKREYYERLLNGNNNKSAWKLIKNVIGNQRNVGNPTAIRNQGQLITDPQQVSVSFNDHFCAVGPNLSSTIMSSRNINRFGTLGSLQSTIFLKPATRNEIILLIKQLDSRKATGPDGIPVSFIKNHHGFFASLLMDTFNEIIVTGQFPDCLKIARVTPVFKSGDPKDMNNYRPISTLSIIDKVLEKLLVCRIMEFSEKHQLVYGQQYGFRQGSSTLTACHEFVEEIYDALDNKQIVGALFIDLKKAFDTVDHVLLLRKLESYGIRGLANDLLKSYLSDRHQYVSIAEFKSPLRPVTTGVPQGSNLGPILFLLFVNDVAGLNLHGKLRLFADDTAVFYRGTDCNVILNQIKTDLELLRDFFGENVLSLNLAKTKYMLIHSPRRSIPAHQPIIICGHNLDEVDEHEFLGLTLDCTMSWGSHIKKLKTKVSSICGILRKISSFMPQTCLKQIYFALVHSKLQYLTAVWGSASKANLRELQVLQNRCLKIVLRKPFLYPTVNLYSNVNDSLLPITALHEYQVLVQMQKIIKGTTTHHNTILRRNQQSRASRQANHISLFRPNTEFGKKKFTYFGSKLYNALPENCKNAQNLQHYKSFVRKALKQRLHQLI